METSFNERGVTNCSKVLDITNSLNQQRPYFGIPGTSFAEVSMGNAVPGPYQFKIHVPRGAKSVTVTTQGGGGFNGGTVRMQILASADQPITFARSGASDLINDAQKTLVPTSANNVQTGKVLIDVPCGGDVYVAIGNTSQRDRTLFNVGFAYEQADMCPEPVVDAGIPDPEPVIIPAAQELLGGKVEGCGCSSTVPFMLFPALMLFLRRRRS
jgi:hypothetical protein